ncbi:MAG: leucine--tRNA ligase, partial [Bacteroidales bacterium]
HVGHPLGYIASDIYARYKRLKGFNVLHPMGYDAFGLPAEQYAIQTGQHPQTTTEQNIARYREQLDKIGFSFDWSREVMTCKPKYYKWTQKTFIQLYNHYYDPKTQQAKPIEDLITRFSVEGNIHVDAVCGVYHPFTADEWQSASPQQKEQWLMEYRLAYQKDGMVNWCSELGTVLANDEVVAGLSVRGGYAVERKLMRQWNLRITAYADRLLEGLNALDWSESLKETQRNWIGKSTGANVFFKIKGLSTPLEVFTTRADTIFGVTFMVICPEHELLQQISLSPQVEAYIAQSKNKSERERQSEVKNISGEATGLYAINPFTKAEIPIYVSDYVLSGYGTGAIMAVPAHDSRDYAFAKHFALPIIPLIEGCDVSTESFDAKDGIMKNSDFLNGVRVKDAIKMAIARVEELGIGTAKINYRLRDAAFSRQRYWGEPFPVYYKDGMPQMLSFDQLPLELPSVDKYLPTETGEPPLGRATNWLYENEYPYELSTMPGFAGSSAYFLRYMSPQHTDSLVDKTENNYWRNVDLYIGGAEHATGHLMYARFWNMFLYDIGEICEQEPFKKLVNQGMIQGRSNFVYRLILFKNRTDFEANINPVNTRYLLSYHYAKNLIKTGGDYDFLEKVCKEYIMDPHSVMVRLQEIHVDVNIVHNDVLDIDKFKAWRPEFANTEFKLDGDKYICGWAVEKMSKSMYNVVNPDDIIAKYGADTLRMYEMFLGPLEMAKPWDTNGIDGVHRFLRKLWKLFFDQSNELCLSHDVPTPKELKILHKTIKKITTDIEHFSFNTSISAFMICVNELTEQKCHKIAILEPLTILLAPFAPHIAEELWEFLGHTNSSICDAQFPSYDESLLIEKSFEYPISFNGKMRFKKEMPTQMPSEQAQELVMNDPALQKFLEGKPIKKFIFVAGKIVNIVY